MASESTLHTGKGSQRLAWRGILQIPVLALNFYTLSVLYTVTPILIYYYIILYTCMLRDFRVASAMAARSLEAMAARIDLK